MSDNYSEDELLLLQETYTTKLKPEENNTHDCYKYDSYSEPERNSCLNWENIVAISCLLLAYLLCNMSYSIMGAFFPDEVNIASTS